MKLKGASEIASGYKYFIEHHRDVANFIFWADNCSAQNKNWHLFTLFTTLVNCKDAPHLKNITLKYFERGHTFMSADAYHHLVEKAMCEMKNVYNYNDFVKALEQDGQTLLLDYKTFFEIPRGVSESKRTKSKPKLERISIAKFVRGSTQVYWRLLQFIRIFNEENCR